VPLRPVQLAMPAAAPAAELARLLGLPQPVLRELNPALRPAVWSGERPVPAGYRLHLPSDSPWTAERLAAVMRVTPGTLGAAGSMPGDAASP
jgi:hypothetical protein